jgi:hypothetical protein
MNFSHWFSIESASCDLRRSFGWTVSEALTVTTLWDDMGIRNQGVWSRGMKSVSSKAIRSSSFAARAQRQ